MEEPILETKALPKELIFLVKFLRSKKFVYNVGGRQEWEKEIKDYLDSVLKAVGRDDAIVTYKEAEPFTTKVKHMDFSKAVRDLGCTITSEIF